MQSNELLGELLKFFSTIHIMAKPIVVLQLLIILLLVRPEPPKDIWKCASAVFYYLLEVVGIALMTVGALPTLIAVLGGYSFPPELYLGLLLIFATGGILFLWVDNHLRELPKDVTLLPSVLYLMSMKIIGTISVIFSALALSIAIVTNSTLEKGWWAMPVVILGYGTLLCWLTAPQERSNWSDASVGSIMTKSPTKKKTATRKKKK